MVTIQDIKNSAKLFDYGDNAEAGQITDNEIQNLIDKISSDIDAWLGVLKAQIGSEYNKDRYIALEVIIALALSNYNDAQKTYIEALKVERDRYKEELAKSVRRFSASLSTAKMPTYNNGKVFD